MKNPRNFLLLATSSFLYSLAARTVLADPQAPTKSLTEVALDLGLTTFVDLLEATGFVFAPALRFTLFVPVDVAFAALPESDRLLACLKATAEEPGNPLSYILGMHIVIPELRSSSLKFGNTITNTRGEGLLIGNSAFGMTIGDSTIVLSFDNLAIEGVIHMINKVLLPPSFDAEAYLADSCPTEAPPPPPPPPKSAKSAKKGKKESKKESKESKSAKTEP